MNVLKAGDKIGRYEIIAKVGEGGMSVVFEGFDPTLERYVAIKLIKIESFPANLVDTVKERFVREAKALAQLNHPNIVKVYDFGEFEDAPYLVMDYLEGPTFKAIRKPVPLEAAVDLIKPVADALAYIHSKGLLHRDIKASNIILLSGNHPVLTDFGIAKWIEAKDDQLTLTGQGFGLGTPEYMSPEQGMGKAVDHRSDQYSLAIVFYELITGRRPYTDETVVAVLVKQVNEPVPDPRQFVPELSESVVKFFKIALAKDLSDRHADINTFLLDLDGLKLQAQMNRAKGVAPYQVKTDDRILAGPSTGSSVKISETAMRKVRAEEGVKPEVVSLERVPSAKNLTERTPEDDEKKMPTDKAVSEPEQQETGGDGANEQDAGAQDVDVETEAIKKDLENDLECSAPKKESKKARKSGSLQENLKIDWKMIVLVLVGLIGILWVFLTIRNHSFPANKTALTLTQVSSKDQSTTESQPFLSMISERGMTLDDVRVVSVLDRGTMTRKTGEVSTLPSSVSVENFYVSAAFTLPKRKPVHYYDFGYYFRSDKGRDYVFSIKTNGSWCVDHRDEKGWHELECGFSDVPIDLHENLLDLAVIGSEGVFMINGKLGGEFNLGVEGRAGGIGPMMGIYDDSSYVGGDKVTVAHLTVNEIKRLITPEESPQSQALNTTMVTKAPVKTPQSTATATDPWSDAFVSGVTAAGIYDRKPGYPAFRHLLFTIDPGTTDITGQKFAICTGTFRGNCDMVNGKLHCGIPQTWDTSNKYRCLSLFNAKELKACSWGHSRPKPVFNGCADEADWEYMVKFIPRQ